MRIPILSPATKKIAAKIKATKDVSFNIFLVLFLTRLFWFLATASDISGIRRVETELSIADGKKRIGKAMPFIIPNCESAEELPCAYFAKFFGTKIFSAVLKRLFKYLPDVIGVAISFIFFTIF